MTRPPYHIVLFSWQTSLLTAKTLSQCFFRAAKFTGCGFKSRKRYKKVWAGVPGSNRYSQQRYFVFLMHPSVWSYLRWLVTLKDVTFAAQWYYVLASTISITAARCKCSLSPKDIPFPKAVLCQDESSMFLPELSQSNSSEVHGMIQNLN